MSIRFNKINYHHFKLNVNQHFKRTFSTNNYHFINKPISYKNLLVVGGLGIGLTSAYLYKKPSIYLESNKTPTLEDNIIEPSTGLSFPRFIQPIQSEPNTTFQLVGCGVRRVTFMGFTAYSIGIYINNQHLNKLLNSGKWKSFDKAKFLGDNEYCEELIEDLINHQYEFLIQIIPVRNTNGSHIKGGLIRSLQYHLNQQKQNNLLSHFDIQDIETSINEFGQTFPKGMIEIYSKLNFIKKFKNNEANVIVIQDNHLRGYVDNQWIINNLLRAYLSGKKLISQEIRLSFSEEVDKLIQ